MSKIRFINPPTKKIGTYLSSQTETTASSPGIRRAAFTLKIKKEMQKYFKSNA